MVQILLCNQKLLHNHVSNYNIHIVGSFCQKLSTKSWYKFEAANFQKHEYYLIHFGILHYILNLLEFLLLGKIYIIEKPDLLLTRNYMQPKILVLVA
jgi:hypothetical protein